jgi:hypothetical protein
MTLTEYSMQTGALTVTITSPRPEALPATVMPAATLHSEIAATVRCALRTHRHVAPHPGVPAALQLGTYLPAGYYALRRLEPEGSVVEVDSDFLLDVCRLRYGLAFALLPAAVGATGDSEKLAFAFERHLARAAKDLLVTGWGLAGVYATGDDDARRPLERTEVGVHYETGLSAAPQAYAIGG